ncbi:hypothetical protein F3Y22_tig00116974pilonHSYRG00020 [Hibiscus syriacus]|uniref:UBC core domain-containing protein n=1 Tax=Hibiscus syriacus TaxID=106335 RepID=A0A6A2WHG7_HIBSY|nr:hypothetical protein F3Y22_tig00116974pilonHSYRG00020 [Hibiscus syriacus]
MNSLSNIVFILIPSIFQSWMLHIATSSNIRFGGARQPSLNISTVLRIIRLLLSEPNPDDGLMCEASTEYKYNRQAFDHKARSMTEKYAKVGAGESSCRNQCTETKADSTMMEVQGLGQEPNHVAQDFNPSHKRSHVESKRKRQEENYVLNKYMNHEKINGKGRKSSSKNFDQCNDSFDKKENVDSNYFSPLCQYQASSGFSLSQASRNQHEQDEDGNSGNNSTKSSSKLH